MTRKIDKVEAAKAEASNDLLLGIDLGTSRTAVLSNRGLKTLFGSVVGYPKDIIAIKLIQDNQIIGDEALENSQFLDLYAPLENGTIKSDPTQKDLDAVRALLEHALLQADAHEGDRKCAIIGVPAKASSQNVALLLDLAKDVFDISLVVSEPFLVAYGMKKILNAIVVDIGAGTTDICILKGILPGPKDQITSFMAGDYLDRELQTMIVNKYPNVQVTRNQVRKIKEKHSFVAGHEATVEVDLREHGKPVKIDCTKEVRKVCEQIVPTIVEAIEKLVVNCNPEKQAEVLQNIFLAGGGSQIKGLSAMIMEELKAYGKVKVTAVGNPDYAGCEGGLKLAIDVPPESWDKIGPVCGK